MITAVDHVQLTAPPGSEGELRAYFVTVLGMTEIPGIERYGTRLQAHGAYVEWDENLPGHKRFYSYDPAGNRLEFLEPVGG